jgi:hypothetical protein
MLLAMTTTMDETPRRCRTLALHCCSHLELPASVVCRRCLVSPLQPSEVTLKNEFDYVKEQAEKTTKALAKRFVQQMCRSLRS